MYRIKLLLTITLLFFVNLEISDAKSSNSKIFKKFAGTWGIHTCRNPEIGPRACEKPWVIIDEKGMYTTIEYKGRKFKEKKRSSFQLEPRKDGKTLQELGDGDGQGEHALILEIITESGIPVLHFQTKKQSFKFVSMANLRRGFQVNDPGSNKPRVAKYRSTTLQGGKGVLASLSIGSKPSSVSLSGQCGLPLAKVSEKERRRWYNEASKKLSFGPFQNNRSATREIRSIGTPSGFSSVCEATSKQVYAILPSLNGAISSSNRLHNGSPIGLRCLSGGASTRAACQATQLVYTLKTVSYMCHQVCK